MPLCRYPLTLRLALFSRSRTAAVEIPRFILHWRRSEFLPLHRGAEVRSQYTSVPPCYQNVPPRAAHLNILSQSDKIFHTREARISPRRRRDFTRRLAAVFHCGAASAACAARSSSRAVFISAAVPRDSRCSKLLSSSSATSGISAQKRFGMWVMRHFGL